MKTYNNYTFDLDNIMDFIYGDQAEVSNDVEITQGYIYNDAEKKLVPSHKEVKEVKADASAVRNSTRYDLIRTFIDILDAIEDEQLTTIGQKMTLNTMEAYGFIKDLNSNDDE